MPKPRDITLTYFDIPGPAEAIRLAFYMGGVPFVDRRVDRDEFLQMKADLPFGQLPLLEVDGDSFAQSGAILRFAGKLGGLYPEDPVLAAKCDAVLDGMFDIQAAIRPSIYEVDPQRKMKMRAQLASYTLPTWLGYMEGVLQKAGAPYFVGDSPLICDLVIYTRMKWLRRGVLEGIPENILDPFPLMSAHSELMGQHPKLLEYYTTGPGQLSGDKPALASTFDAIHTGRSRPVPGASTQTGLPPPPPKSSGGGGGEGGSGETAASS